MKSRRDAVEIPLDQGAYSMNRIPEPDLMNDPVQARAYADTDFSEAHDAFVSHFLSRFPAFTKGSVLDLGCGTADVIIRFANALPHTSITGIDGAKAMLDIGREAVTIGGLQNRIYLMEGLLPDNELSSMIFDAVISNSLLHHLGSPVVLWDTVKKCSSAGAPLFIMDLMRPENSEMAREIVSRYAAGAPAVLQKDFYNSLLAAYRVDEIQEQLTAAGLRYLSTEVISDRHLLVWGTKQ